MPVSRTTRSKDRILSEIRNNPYFVARTRVARDKQIYYGEESDSENESDFVAEDSDKDWNSDTVDTDLSQTPSPRMRQARPGDRLFVPYDSSAALAFRKLPIEVRIAYNHVLLYWIRIVP